MTSRFFFTAVLLMILIALALPAPAHAAAGGVPLDRRDFEAAAEQAAPMAGASYRWARCAGLYRSVRLHAGRRALGAERWDYATQVEGALTRKAALTRAEDQGQPWRSAQMQAEVDVAALSRLYLARYEAQIAATGRPWSRDPLWAEDNRTCGDLLNGL
ncbi:MAG: hypothetical protein AAFU80_25975 [Pseudomonadota bacterium]